MYELFILGELLDQPLHGYLLRDVVNLAIGPLRQLSWGALYPLIRRLNQAGLVEQVPDESDTSARPRKVYRITQAGRERFFFLMLKPEEYTTDYFDIFNIKLINFDQLTVEQQLGLLQHYRGYAQFALDYLNNNQRHVATESNIPQSERAAILYSLAHRIALATTDLEWVNTEIARLTTPSGDVQP